MRIREMFNDAQQYRDCVHPTDGGLVICCGSEVSFLSSADAGLDYGPALPECDSANDHCGGYCDCADDARQEAYGLLLEHTVDVPSASEAAWDDARETYTLIDVAGREIAESVDGREWTRNKRGIDYPYTFTRVVTLVGGPCDGDTRG